MSAQLFDSQLLITDDTKSHQQIAALITAGDYSGPGLSNVAHKYLDAFCNPGISDSRRRWAGIALVGMIRASPTVAQRLKKLTRGLPRVGNIILDSKESEEHKIVAGLIIRQGLEAGIDFADFWASDKVPHSAPNFPREAGEPWMGQFQAYLDILSNLKLANSADDPMIVYPMSISAGNDFQWTGTSAVAAIERGLLTIVVSDSTLTKFRFLELPVSHIKQAHLRQESPYESQEGHSEYSMYTLTITLQSKSLGYRLDSSDCEGSEIRVSFHDREDAAEFEAGLQDTSKSTAKYQAGDSKTTRSARTGSSTQDQRQSSAEPAKANRGQHALQRSDVDSKQTHGQVVPSEHPDQERESSLQATDERMNGKLPRVSKATIQKVARTQHLQSKPSKSSKARAAKKATSIVISSSDEEESWGSSQDEYDLKSAATVRSSANIGASRTASNRRRVYEEDEDFVPSGSKTKAKSTKRKRGSSDAAEQIQPPKKKTQRPDNTIEHPMHSSMAKLQDPMTGIEEQTDTSQARRSTKQPAAQQQQITQNGNSARPSLIGALKKSKSSAGGATPIFKRPGQPASTPGRPRTHGAQITPKPRTPVEVCKDSDDLPNLFQTSTPRSQLMHEEDFGLGHTPADTEILSSNTKKVPDSPHAESTAISGHADQEDVHREKHRADLETAKSDPFQRRQGSKIPTTFLRKLTGEGSVEEVVKYTEPPTLPTEVSQDDQEADELPTGFASQPLPKDSPSLFKHRAQTNHQARALEHAQALTFEDTRAAHISQNNPTRTERSLDTSERSSPAHAAAKRIRLMDVIAEEEQVRPNDSVISGPPESVEDTLLDEPDRAIDMEDETTLTSEAIDMPKQYGGNAADLRFRSSPPIPDSSSIRDACSSEREPEPSPQTSRADEIEWEQHQRRLHEQSMSTSKQVVRSIVANETAVTDIANVFAEDGERLVDLDLERQCSESAEAFQELASMKQDLLKELTETSEHLRQQREELKADK